MARPKVFTVKSPLGMEDGGEVLRALGRGLSLPAAPSPLTELWTGRDGASRVSLLSLRLGLLGRSFGRLCLAAVDLDALAQGIHEIDDVAGGAGLTSGPMCNL
jgi:hypothetical protein